MQPSYVGGDAGISASNLAGCEEQPTLIPAATAPAQVGPMTAAAPMNLSPILSDCEMRRLVTTYRVAARQSCENLILGTCRG